MNTSVQSRLLVKRVSVGLPPVSRSHAPSFRAECLSNFSSEDEVSSQYRFSNALAWFEIATRVIASSLRSQCLLVA